MRLPCLFMTMLVLAGCGGESPRDSGQPEDAGVTLKLPPATPAEDEAPAPAAAEETVAVEDDSAAAEPPQAGEPRLVPASPPIAQASLARYITRAGFNCDEVVTVTRLERADGSRAGIYKFECATGGDYQGTMRNDHLYFRPWEGMPE